MSHLQLKFLFNIPILTLTLYHTVPATLCNTQNKTPKTRWLLNKSTKKHSQDFIHNYSKREEFHTQGQTPDKDFLSCCSQKQAAPRAQRHPRLVIEECPLTCDTLTNEVVKELLEKVTERFFKLLLDFYFYHPCKWYTVLVVVWFWVCLLVLRFNRSLFYRSYKVILWCKRVVFLHYLLFLI